MTYLVVSRGTDKASKHEQKEQHSVGSIIVAGVHALVGTEGVVRVENQHPSPRIQSAPVEIPDVFTPKLNGEFNYSMFENVPFAPVTAFLENSKLKDASGIMSFLSWLSENRNLPDKWTVVKPPSSCSSEGYHIVKLMEHFRLQSSTYAVAPGFASAWSKAPSADEKQFEAMVTSTSLASYTALASPEMFQMFLEEIKTYITHLAPHKDMSMDISRFKYSNKDAQSAYSVGLQGCTNEVVNEYFPMKCLDECKGTFTQKMDSVVKTFHELATPADRNSFLADLLNSSCESIHPFVRSSILCAFARNQEMLGDFRGRQTSLLKTLAEFVKQDLSHWKLVCPQMYLKYSCAEDRHLTEGLMKKTPDAFLLDYSKKFGETIKDVFMDKCWEDDIVALYDAATTENVCTKLRNTCKHPSEAMKATATYLRNFLIQALISLKGTDRPADFPVEMIELIRNHMEYVLDSRPSFESFMEKFIIEYCPELLAQYAYVKFLVEDKNHNIGKSYTGANPNPSDPFGHEAGLVDFISRYLCEVAPTASRSATSDYQKSVQEGVRKCIDSTIIMNWTVGGEKICDDLTAAFAKPAEAPSARAIEGLAAQFVHYYEVLLEPVFKSGRYVDQTRANIVGAVVNSTDFSPLFAHPGFSTKVRRVIDKTNCNLVTKAFVDAVEDLVNGTQKGEKTVTETPESEKTVTETPEGEKTVTETPEGEKTVSDATQSGTHTDHPEGEQTVTGKPEGEQTVTGKPERKQAATGKPDTDKPDAGESKEDQNVSTSGTEGNSSGGGADKHDESGGAEKTTTTGGGEPEEPKKKSSFGASIRAKVSGWFTGCCAKPKNG